MIAKVTGQLRIASDFLAIGKRAPHVWYANLDFGSPDIAHQSWRLISWIKSQSCDWKRKQALRYLKKHQHKFRRTLNWIVESCFFDDDDIDPDDIIHGHKMWEMKPEVRFLQMHGIDHGGIALAPEGWWSGGCRTTREFSGLELTQRKPKDPLDPICWHVLFLLSVYGTLSIRRCRYHECGHFFFPKTARALFCSDSCRALHHVAHIEIEHVLQQYTPEDAEPNIHKVPTKFDMFRNARAKYMRTYRANPLVKKRARHSRRKKWTAVKSAPLAGR